MEWLSLYVIRALSPATPRPHCRGLVSSYAWKTAMLSASMLFETKHPWPAVVCLGLSSPGSVSAAVFGRSHASYSYRAGAVGHREPLSAESRCTMSQACGSALSGAVPHMLALWGRATPQLASPSHRRGYLSGSRADVIKNRDSRRRLCIPTNTCLPQQCNAGVCTP